MGLPEASIQELVDAVAASGHQIGDAAFDAFQMFLGQCDKQPGGVEAACRRIAPEYGRAEYLLCVDHSGKGTSIPAPMLNQILMLCKRWPAWEASFRIVGPQDGSEPALLIARWLCHLAGFRHRTVHLFLDHPILSDHTLIQVRGINKEEAPGRFGLPVAGHIVGLDTTQETLAKELGEELGLSIKMLADLRHLGCYESKHPSDLDELCNVECHEVYRARLSSEGWLCAHARDAEVAAIAAFQVADLYAMVDRFPERVASGLKGSLSMYGC